MIITHINIKNYLSYYGDNFFELSDGLTLLIGDNGDGKTSFFDALKWLLDTTDNTPNIELVSAKAKSELEIDNELTVSVSMTFKHLGEKQVEKSFRVKRTSAIDYKIVGFRFEGYVNSGSERYAKPGKEIIDNCFDAFMQRFSMFKGETQLNVLNDQTAFKQLIEKYSDLKDFEPLVEMSESFESRSFKVLEKERRNDSKTANRARQLSSLLADVQDRIRDLRDEIKSHSESQQNYIQNIEKIENNQDKSERFAEIESRMNNKTKELNMFIGRRNSLNPNTSLLDKKWILCAFPSILEAFNKKCSLLHKTREQIGKDWLVEQVKKETLNEVQTMIGKELRWDIPDRQTMEEMIKAERCWVCGHAAPKGSDEYNYMLSRLEDYKKHLEPAKPVEEQSLFKNEYTEELYSLSLSMQGPAEAEVARKSTDIKEALNIQQAFDKKIRALKSDIEELNKEKARLLLNSDGMTEDMYRKIFTDYRGLLKMKADNENKLNEAQRELVSAEQERDEYKKQMDELPGTGMATVYSRINHCFSKILNAFKGAKEANLTQFLISLETAANKYMERLNVDDFHGIIQLRKSTNRNGETTASIDLLSQDGSRVGHKSGSQEVTMYMSVLFAISELTTIAKSENYPLIFDAPAGTFGEAKRESFYNVIDELDKQCIIVTKDFITKEHRLQQNALANLTCKVYHIRKAEGFVPGDLSTVQTIVTPIKF